MILYQFGGDQQLGVVVDYCYWFVCLFGVDCQFLGFGQVVDLVGIDYFVGQQQGVVVVQVGVFEGVVDVEGVGWLVMVLVVYFVGFVGKNFYCGVGVFQGFFWIGQFDLFEIVGYQGGDDFVVQGLGYGVFFDIGWGYIF